MHRSVAGIIKKKNRYLLGKRKPGGAIGNLWEFPGGKVENNETLDSALIREYIEELNIDILVDSFIVEKEFKSYKHNFRLYAFYIKIKSEYFTLNEHTLCKWFSLEEIKKLGNELAKSDQILLDYL